MLLNRKLKLLFIFFSVLMITIPLVSSCQRYPHYVTDPASKTLGYKLFRGDYEGLYVSFEYPDSWRRESRKDETFEIFDMLNQSLVVSIRSHISAAQGGDYKGGHELIQDLLGIFSKYEEFQIISQGSILIGGVEGEELSCSYRIRGMDAHSGADIDKVLTDRELAVDYNGRIYHISLGVDADKYEGIKEGFEHLLATFRFLACTRFSICSVTEL